MAESVRVDKWLWAVRVFKTRSLSSEACRKGHVTIGGLPVKPSRPININDIVKVRKTPVVRTYKVLGLSGKRMSAKLAPDFVEDITPKEELEILEIQKNMLWHSRDKGAGRPTKKERRDMDKLMGI
ncbi:Ribosome-associated heat shock protein implicated in the recycling of the 50S subunit (S4 paralog) [hydrothermal vent metagenome]|uniref:Ribosome-associated heat shock protein implicated in the recycling of the 50S subunit (S4 paralog) n=1 Tax=hydrothermal vent metagenome TaxID=652676 RepID=A0A3B0U0I5_9ZZZZ